MFGIYFVSFCSLSLLSGQIIKGENMLSTSYLKTSKSSICRISSKTGIRQSYYIRPPPVSTQTVEYRIHYRVAVDLGNAPQGVVPLSPSFWWTKIWHQAKTHKLCLLCPNWSKKGPTFTSSSHFWAYSVSILFSVFCTLWAYCCSIVCVFTTTFFLKTINLHLSLDYPFDIWIT